MTASVTAFLLPEERMFSCWGHATRVNSAGVQWHRMWVQDADNAGRAARRETMTQEQLRRVEKVLQRPGTPSSSRNRGHGIREEQFCEEIRIIVTPVQPCQACSTCILGRLRDSVSRLPIPLLNSHHTPLRSMTRHFVK